MYALHSMVEGKKMVDTKYILVKLIEGSYLRCLEKSYIIFLLRLCGASYI